MLQSVIKANGEEKKVENKPERSKPTYMLSHAQYRK